MRGREKYTTLENDEREPDGSSEATAMLKVLKGELAGIMAYFRASHSSQESMDRSPMRSCLGYAHRVGA